VGGDFEPG